MLFFDILLGIVSLAITGVITIAVLWVSIYIVLDIISRLKKYRKNGDDWRIDLQVLDFRAIRGVTATGGLRETNAMRKDI